MRSGTNGPSSVIDLELDSSITMHDHCKADKAIHETQGIYEPETQMEDRSDRNKDNDLEDKSRDPDANQTEGKINSVAATVLILILRNIYAIQWFMKKMTYRKNLVVLL